jgi:DNA-binding GntR family transcriptional regulator
MARIRPEKCVQKAPSGDPTPVDPNEPRSRIYTGVVEKIIKGEYPPGRQLIEQELAKTFQVSRTPIREALFALERDGLVERSRNCGARVVSFTPDDVEQIYEIRKSLECLSVRTAARNLSLHDLLEFERRFTALRECEGEEWTPQQLAVDQEFHWLIVSHSGNRRLIAYLENVSLLLDSLRALVQPYTQGTKRRADEHIEIVRALARRDAEAAERLLASHIETAKQRTIELLADQLLGRRPR